MRIKASEKSGGFDGVVMNHVVTLRASITGDDDGYQNPFAESADILERWTGCPSSSLAALVERMKSEPAAMREICVRILRIMEHEAKKGNAECFRELAIIAATGAVSLENARVEKPELAKLEAAHMGHWPLDYCPAGGHDLRALEAITKELQVASALPLPPAPRTHSTEIQHNPAVVGLLAQRLIGAIETARSWARKQILPDIIRKAPWVHDAGALPDSLKENIPATVQVAETALRWAFDGHPERKPEYATAIAKRRYGWQYEQHLAGEIVIDRGRSDLAILMEILRPLLRNKISAGASAPAATE